MTGDGSMARKSGASPEVIDMVGSRFELAARMGDADADTVFFRTRMSPGKLVPLHSHDDPECFYVLSGTLGVFVVDEEPRWRTLPPAHSLVVTRGIRHAVRNAGDEPVDMILATNNRMARFFREAGRPVMPGEAFQPPSPDDIARMLRLAATYGYWNASPAEHAAMTGETT